MKTATSFALNLAAAVLIVIASAAVALAQAGTDTCAGLDATIGGTCTPLTNSTSGTSDSTALGSDALRNNTTGINNTATGESSLQDNTTGSGNTGTGVNALLDNTAGGNNTSTGVDALFDNTTGSDNTATGYEALLDNIAGGNNTATGVTALQQNVTGVDNTATGVEALLDNTTGSSNIGIGLDAGSNLTTGDNNIDIGNEGVAAESSTIRIGIQSVQTDTYVAGIFGTPKIKKACEVVVESTGLLGCVKSSARYKRDIHDMGDASDKLMKLRPVRFRYKADSTSIQQYGLIAEEVEKVYPELVINDADGNAETVEYQVLPAMLLNEVQKQSRQIAEKDAQIAALQRQLDALQKKNSEIDAMAQRLDALERQARASRPDRLAAGLR
jgi:hypothetical protein